MELCELTPDKYCDALELAWKVFLQFEAPDYPEEGVKAFYSSINDPDFICKLRVYGAYDGNTLAGMLATRSSGEHIALFFVEEKYQRLGIGKQLFALACRDNVAGRITVNSSPFAVEIYRRLGFTETDREQSVEGIRFTPMECILSNPDCPCRRVKCSRRGSCFACREHHKTEKHYPVACERPEKASGRDRNRRRGT